MADCSEQHRLTTGVHAVHAVVEPLDEYRQAFLIACDNVVHDQPRPDWFIMNASIFKAAGGMKRAAC